MARALIVGLIELGSLAIFSACVAVLTFAIRRGFRPGRGRKNRRRAANSSKEADQDEGIETEPD